MLGRKGTGKTALLKYIELRSDYSGIKCLYLKPDDIPLLEGISSAEETATIKRKAHHALVSAVSAKIGAELKGLLGKKDKRLFDKAIREDFRSPDAVQACLRGLSNFGSATTDIKFEKLVPKAQDSRAQSLTESLKANFKKSGKVFFLLLDDVDQVASLENQQHINRIWGFILAAQKLTEELPNFKTIICLRTEIWSLLERDRYGQRDQVDHVRRLIRRLDPSDGEIKDILQQRLYVVRNKENLPTNSRIMELFFKERSVILPTTDDSTRDWLDFIVKSSRGRPRDALQFLGLLAKKSRESGYDKITTTIVDSAAEQYSKERLDDLVREYAKDCSSVREIVNSFSCLDFQLSTDQMREHLISIPSRFGFSIRGRTIHRENLSDIFLLWRFLHEIGVWNPCIPDNREDRNFRHMLFDDHPNFIEESNWSNMQKTMWELHPAYRSYLLEQRKNDDARQGISLRSFFGKK
ncbi:hypothetical protein EGM51_00065 [Verrucomicrobia bacterium S94]|nr:hypothetical protein EGM51_00065 [Verrucomicrobia bacterium S94]